MNKKINKLLKNSYIKAKWCNMGTWKKEDYTNLLELVEQNSHLKIIPRKGKGNYTIRWDYGCQRNKTLTNEVDLIKNLQTMLVQKCIYLGDKCKIDTRNKSWNL